MSFLTPTFEIDDKNFEQYLGTAIEVERMYKVALMTPGIENMVCTKTGAPLKEALQKNLKRVRRHFRLADLALYKDNVPRFCKLCWGFLRWIDADKPHGISFRWVNYPTQIEILGAEYAMGELVSEKKYTHGA